MGVVGSTQKMQWKTLVIGIQDGMNPNLKWISSDNLGAACITLQDRSSEPFVLHPPGCSSIKSLESVLVIDHPGSFILV